MKKKLLSLLLALCCSLPFALTAASCGENSPSEETSSEEASITPHTHNWATTWSTNASEHWLTCSLCEEKKDKGNHDGDICSICGYDAAFEALPTHTVRDLEIINMQAGQGITTLVKLPDGKDMLIDSGGERSASDVQNFIWDYVEDLTIEYFVLTSTTSYVTGAAPYIFADFSVLNFYRPSVKSNHALASELATPYNSGDSVFVEDGKNYAEALEYSSYETGCEIHLIDDTSCDIICEFRDTQNNIHSYTIDFMLPIVAADRTDRFDNTVMLSIEYKDTVTLFTSDATNNLIDAYCNTYGNQKDVDVLITYFSGLEETKYAISRSDLRGTNFLEKIHLDGDHSILVPIANANFGELLPELKPLSTLYGAHQYENITVKVTSSGELTVTPN